MKLLNTEQINRICMKNGFQQDKHEKNKINLIKNDIGNIEVNNVLMLYDMISVDKCLGNMYIYLKDRQIAFIDGRGISSLFFIKGFLRDGGVGE